MRKLLLACAVIALIGCSSGTEPSTDWASITLISGANQTVTVNRSGLTDLPDLVVVRVDSLGTPMRDAEIHVNVHMSGAPGPNGPYYFVTGADGVAAMQLQLSNPLGPVSVIVDYVKCATFAFKGCESFRTLASVRVPGIVAQ